MVFNATFNNISAISSRSVLLVKQTRELGENHLQKYESRKYILIYYWLIFLRDLFSQSNIASKAKPEMCDAMWSPSRAKHIKDSMVNEDFEDLSSDFSKVKLTSC